MGARLLLQVESMEAPGITVCLILISSIRREELVGGLHYMQPAALAATAGMDLVVVEVGLVVGLLGITGVMAVMEAKAGSL